MSNITDFIKQIEYDFPTTCGTRNIDDDIDDAKIARYEREAAHGFKYADGSTPRVGDIVLAPNGEVHAVVDFYCDVFRNRVALRLRGDVYTTARGKTKRKLGRFHPMTVSKI